MMEDKLISSNELKKIVSRMVELPNEMRAQMIGAINRAGEAVVRCKDCKHNDPQKALADGCLWCRYWGIDPDPDDFCSYGERRTDD